MSEQPKRVADLLRAITTLSKESGTTERRLVALVGQHRSVPIASTSDEVLIVTNDLGIGWSRG